MVDTNSPNKGFIYLEDGSEDNVENLSRSLRILDSTVQLILESFSETETPTSQQLEPGQAWFVPAGTATTGGVEGWPQFHGQGTGQIDEDSVLFYGFTNYAAKKLGWTQVPIREAAWGYIVDQGDRFQWDGSEWVRQVKEQATTQTKFWETTVPLPNSSTVYIPFFQAPFRLKITDLTLVLSGLSTAAILPRVAYTDDPTLPFAQWTTIVTEGPTDGLGDWDAATISAAAAAAHTVGLKTTTAANTIIEPGRFIAFGGWSATDPTGSNPDRYSATLNSTSINTSSIILDFVEIN